MWDFLKDVKLDLSKLTPEQADLIVKKMKDEDVAQVLSDLQEATKDNEKVAHIISTVVKIVEFAIEKGIFKGIV